MSIDGGVYNSRKYTESADVVIKVILGGINKIFKYRAIKTNVYLTNEVMVEYLNSDSKVCIIDKHEKVVEANFEI